jgi:hypothetical protein
MAKTPKYSDEASLCDSRLFGDDGGDRDHVIRIGRVPHA